MASIYRLAAVVVYDCVKLAIGVPPVKIVGEKCIPAAPVGRAGNYFIIDTGNLSKLRGIFPHLPPAGFVKAKPLLTRGLLYLLHGPHNGPFTPRCTPPLQESRWWFASQWDYLLHDLEKEGIHYPTPEDFFEAHFAILTEQGIKYAGERQVGIWPWDYSRSLCKQAAAKQLGTKPPNLYPSPVGPPLSLPGRGALLGAELPVVRRHSGYLRVGQWLAWHRVLGVLDYQPGKTAKKWVLVGDDGLYVAEFTATVKEPLEEFGEVGYVKVVAPYDGDVDEVASPCGAPRLVACTEETVDLLRSLGHKCEAERGIPHVLLGSPEEVALGRETMDWPLADTCDFSEPWKYHAELHPWW